jgi:putative RNA 2'-phosphotransferase
MNSETKTKEPVHRNFNSISRLVTRGLRHAPGILGVQLDAQGWVAVETLLAGLAERRRPLTHDELVQIVRENDKQRLTLSEDGKRIRAAQGHSIKVDLCLPGCTPPALLYHGTVGKSLPAIRSEGLLPMKRHAVHLSSTVATAIKVGERRGQPVILVIDAQRMDINGHRFSVSENGVWLTDAVPVQYIDFP